VDSRVLRDLEYGSIPGYRPLLLDLHLPALAEADHGAGLPLIVFVHGGGWRLGSKRVFGPEISVQESFERIVADGFGVASVDYRLSGEAHFPAQLDDLRLAIGWLREQGDEFGIDASRLVVWGESAGATIGALVALEPGSGVRGVIDWYGPSNLLSIAESESAEELAGSRETGWLGATALDEPELARRASPVFAVAAGAPPFHIEHGAADAFVSPAQSDELAAALSAHGVPVELISVAGANHMWKPVEGHSRPDTAEIVGRGIRFARSVTE
jgi:acetyl esterase/lipase